MNVLEVNYTDLPGRIFDGYDLMTAINGKDTDIHIRQAVARKISDDENVVEITAGDSVLQEQLKLFSYAGSVNNVLSPVGEILFHSEAFQWADLVHYHILHNEMISLLDYPKLMNAKPAVWTIHDPWIFTGGCLHPRACEKWKTGCSNCDRYDETYKAKEDNTAFLWAVKKKALENVSPHIVVSGSFMASYLKQSAFLQGRKFSIIPFGVPVEKYADIKSKRGGDTLTIGFRISDDVLKGCRYIYQALEDLNPRGIQLKVIGKGTIPDHIRKNYDIEEYGWVNDTERMENFYSRCDIFLMPSLAESFGMMAIEAMAAGCVVVCFKGTAVENNIFSPEIGVSVEYGSANALKNEISRLVRNRKEVRKRSIRGREKALSVYSFERYVSRHEELYRQIAKEHGIE